MKKGFELSISILVTIIISIVILGAGLVLLYKFVGGSLEIKNQLDERTDQQLSVLLGSGERIALPFNTATLSRGDSKVIGLGIVNIDEDPHSYNVKVVFDKAYDKQNQPLTVTVDETKWLLYDAEGKTLKSKEQLKLPLLFMVPKNATSGTYAFNVEVYESENLVPPPKKVYITVL